MTMSRSEQAAAALRQHLEEVWYNPRGWRAFSVVNHSVLGLRSLLTGTCFFIVGGLLAMLMRTQLALPEQELVDAQRYNQAFTMHGTVMMFLFALPALSGLAMYLIPKMIGARDLLFPRLSAFGYYCYLFGGLILLSTLVWGNAPDAGWFMYTPLSDSRFSPGTGADFWLIGITFVEISAISTAVELVVSILRSRAPGMTLRDMPIFCWYILAMALMILFGFPPLILGSLLLELERAAGFVFFAVEGGGDPLLWQHLFWLFGHPEVYILFLPAAGIVSTLIPVFAQRPLIGYSWIVFSIILIGFISFGLWVHHMFTVGIPHLAQAFFSIASMLIAIPTGIQLFAWLATLWAGKVVWRLPMLWIFGFLVIFVCGGLTGVMLALVPFDWQVHDTHFVVAHMHYVLVGGMLFPLIAGLYFWLPHLSGRMPSPLLSRWAFWLTFGGFNLTFLLMHLTGLLGMPRRIYTYPADVGWDELNLLSSIGGFVMALGIAMLIVDIALHFRFGRPAGRNPWNAATLEWAQSMPPPAYNHVSLPVITTRHPLWNHPGLAEEMSEACHGLNERSGIRETYGTNAVTAEAQERMHLPSNSWLPLGTAFVIALTCCALLASLYWVALATAIGALLLLLRWSWINGAHPDYTPAALDETAYPPVHWRTRSGPGLWGTATALLADGALYLSLIFGWLYLWTVAPQWSAPRSSPLSLPPLLISGVFLGAASLWYWRGVQGLRQGRGKHWAQRCLLTSGLGLLHVLALLYTAMQAELRPTFSSHDSVLFVLVAYLVLHSGLAVIATLLQARRAQLNYVNARQPYEPEVVLLLWKYALASFWTALAAFVLLPLAWSVP